MNHILRTQVQLITQIQASLWTGKTLKIDVGKMK